MSAAARAQVPVMRAHAESINLEFHRPLEEDRARQLLADFPGVTVLDDRSANRCACPGSLRWRLLGKSALLHCAFL